MPDSEPLSRLPQLSMSDNSHGHRRFPSPSISPQSQIYYECTELFQGNAAIIDEFWREGSGANKITRQLQAFMSNTASSTVATACDSGSTSR
jgi:hypothetical protein